MLENILINIAYCYYPKNICNITEREKYADTIEFKKLKHIINSYSNNDESIQLLTKEFNNNIEINKIQDKTSLSVDRCLTYELEIIENNKVLVRVCLNISLLVPYYILYILENEISIEPYKWLSLPVRNEKSENTKYCNLIKSIGLIVEKNLLINRFPDNLIHKVIPDISFQDNTFNQFTLINAFFLDDIKL